VAANRHPVAAIPVLSTDLKGAITGCNAAALEFFGHTPQEILGKTLAGCAPSGSNLQAIVAAVVRRGLPRPVSM